MIKCYRCGLIKQAEELPNGNNRCAPCHTEYQAERRAKLASGFVANFEGTKSCSTCGIEKAKTEFGIAKGMKDGLQTQCNPCRKISRKRYNDSLKGKAKTLTRLSAVRADEAGRDHSISSDDIHTLWEKQNGKCAATGVDMILDNDTDYSKQSRHPRGLSIDRVDSTKGYTPGNIRLTTTIFNSAQNNWPLSDLLRAAESMAKLHGFTVTSPASPPIPVAPQP